MPMVGHIAETGQVVALDFRPGNVPPAQDNPGFIQQCQQSLPAGCTVKAMHPFRHPQPADTTDQKEYRYR